jgi:hypothetical protein
MIVEIGSALPAGTYSTFTIDANGRITALGPSDESGFEDSPASATSTLSFDNGTRTLTIAPVGASYSFWSGGTRFTKTVPEAKQISDTEGAWLFYFDPAGVLQATQSFTDYILLLHAFVAALYWDATNNVKITFNEERHGRAMPASVHQYLHNTVGSQYGTGLALGGFSVDGSGDLAIHAQFSVADGVIWDEDIQFPITDGAPQNISPIAQIPVFYRVGANGDWRKFAANNFAVIYGGRGAPAAGARANWNQFTGGAWQLTEVPQLEYILTHVYATDDLEEPVIAICGQASYATLSAARTGAINEVHSLSLGGLAALSLEFVRLGTILWQTSTGYTNTAKSRIRALEDGSSYVDWRRYV